MLHLLVSTIAALAITALGYSDSPDPTHPGKQTPTPIPTSDVAAVFEGRTPCGPIATAFTGFPSQGCEKIKWRLTLYRNAANAPTTYRYQGTRTEHEGRWRIVTHGAGSAGRAVYQLSPNGGGAGLSLLSVDEKILLLLDRDGRVLVGDASWSYALNRVDAVGQ